MQNMDSIQMFKKQLKIKLVELRKVTEERGKWKSYQKNIRDLIY